MAVIDSLHQHLIYIHLAYNTYTSLQMLLRRKLTQTKPKTPSLRNWLYSELQKLQFRLTDEYCIFQIMNVIRQYGQFFVIEMFVKPFKGTFVDIQFRPRMIVPFIYYQQRPKIVNDRRVYHPNINMLTCEVVFPCLCVNWNPTLEFTDFFKHLKYILLQPNLEFIPNNILNRRSALDYMYHKNTYRDKICGNSPQYLENFVCTEFQNFEREGVKELLGDQFWRVGDINKRKRMPFSMEQNKEVIQGEGEEDIGLLSKQIVTMSIGVDLWQHKK